ncbi:uncharacterized protein PRCAT00004151001 [Priceomyces carsonii]|uniref:uncharacterized protein n=1 Tax=Priceomyces carsonii TaxID=28549 RepID=UPI002ED7A47B|nr:unnamed protein product [Priceomyces carsonii]
MTEAKKELSESPLAPPVNSFETNEDEYESKENVHDLEQSPSMQSDSGTNELELYSCPPHTPKSPTLSSSDSMMEITPFGSNSNDTDDFVIYSDSDGASLHSLRAERTNSSAEGESTKLKKDRRTPRRSRSRSRSSARGDDDTPSPKPKKRIKRKTKSEAGSERSHKSSAKHSDHYMGSGYTLAPSTGKIFRNLLILEESLRLQVIQQRALRRKYLTFLAVLCSLIASISHHLYFLDALQPANGPLRVILQFVLLALLVTLMLYHLSGEYKKTIVLPRKFLSSTNKGLRQLNIRLVKIKTPVTDTIIDLMREMVVFTSTMCLNCLHKVYPSTRHNRESRLEVFLVSCQLQCQPRTGLTDVKLVLNARVFNTDVREGWELYRSEFWINEGVRRRSNMMVFCKGNYSGEKLDRSKLLKKDRQERKERRKSTVTNSPRLNQQNLEKLNGSLDSINPTQSGMDGL